MCIKEQLSDTPATQLNAELLRFCIVVLFSIAFAYIEAAVVVYLREIFHPDGFAFPLKTFGLSPLWKQLLLTELGREAATLVLILTGAWLFGTTTAQRFAYFMVIFAVWDIFFYVWLKVLLGWPDSILDWDILFLIPSTWAGPVLAPLLISFILLIFAMLILYRQLYARPLKASLMEWLGFILAGTMVVVSFCIAGQHANQPDFEAYFYWPLFAAGPLFAIVLFLKCLLRSNKSNVLPSS